MKEEREIEQLEQKYTKNDVDFAYLTGVFNASGMDGLHSEIQRLKGLGKNPHEIIDSVKNNKQKED